MRVHTLAKELNVSSKAILEKCRAEGLDNVVKNHMSTLSAGLYATIKEWFSEGAHVTAVETSAPVDLTRVRKRRKKKTAEITAGVHEEPVAHPESSESVNEVTSGTAVAQAEAPVINEPSAPTDENEVTSQIAEEPVIETSTPDISQQAIPVAEATVDTSDTASVPASQDTFEPPIVVVDDPKITEEPLTPVPAAEEDVATVVEKIEEEVVAELTEAEQPKPQAIEQKDSTDETKVDEDSVKEESEESDDEKITPAGPQNVPQPAKLKGPRVVRYEAPDPEPPRRRPRKPRPATSEEVQPTEVPAPDPTAKSGKSAKRRAGRVNPRRSGTQTGEADERLQAWRDRDLAERNERLAGATGRRIHRRRSSKPSAPGQPSAGPKTSAKVQEPIQMKDFCSETGLNFIQCFKILKEQHNMLANINMVLPTETAQLLALELGIELEVVPAKTQLDTLKDEFDSRERQQLKTRPPVVTMLGHVDHGKTSLLDAIRESRVAAGEDGGITQHIGADHIKTKQGAVTFLDTPGHEAFTAMRARGARLTDIAVLVVAADDGLMPQTIEAINHAKTAEVPIVVALNKIDLGDQNVMKIYGQLAEHGLTPSGDWGGETDVIHTSATTGEGVSTLLEHLADLGELLELVADPTIPATGTVIEAETKTGVGSVARVLVQEGTLNVGDIVVCGNAAGKVRALVNDQSTKLRKAGPSIPVEIWGLDDVPTSGDRFFVVDNMQRAKSVADEVKQTRLESGRLSSRKVTTLEQMFQQRSAEETPELNIIVKADVDGSVQMLQQTLAKFPSDEVKLTIRHAGVGAINDSDVLLAAACAGIVVAFRVEIPIGVRRLADREGVDIRSYKVVYNVVDDIKKALEGLLAPEEKIEERAVIEVKNVFRISKLGIVAGCLVKDGTVDRTHLARVLRDGKLVRDGCKFDSLRRFKDDVKEVRAGLECGIRLEGFDDVHEGDTIESYEVIKIARTLD